MPKVKLQKYHESDGLFLPDEIELELREDALEYIENIRSIFDRYALINVKVPYNDIFKYSNVLDDYLSDLDIMWDNSAVEVNRMSLVVIFRERYNFHLLAEYIIVNGELDK